MFSGKQSSRSPSLSRSPGNPPQQSGDLRNHPRRHRYHIKDREDDFEIGGESDDER